MATEETGDTTDSTGQASAAASSATASSSAGAARSTWKTHLLTFAVTVLAVWIIGTVGAIYFFPRLVYARAENTVVSHGLGCSGSPGIPINMLSTTPTLALPSKCNSLESTGNRDTLYTVGWLDLGTEPEVLHVPDMAGRYYAVEFLDPWGDVFAYVGRRATGTQAGNYLISGPGWRGAVPGGVRQIVAPDNTVLLIGRTFVYSDSDLATAYRLAKQIQVTPLSHWRHSP
ncbi:MAG TPA: DUF1254 domain-containing protein [Ktedonobacterales bacterium]|nr:DUF1254 domain-containing protein [Ktedonobacterales bacterium]